MTKELTWIWTSTMTRRSSSHNTTALFDCTKKAYNASHVSPHDDSVSN